MVAAGYTHSFCTPHIWPTFPGNTIDHIPAWTAALQNDLNKAKIPLQLIPGGEINLRAEIVNTPDDQIVTYGMKGKFALIDLWADRMPSFFKPGIKRLQSMGLTVILAHPERMRMVQDNPGIADELQAMGLLLQGNLQCLSDSPDSMTRITVERYLAEDRYFLLGSDLHKPETLPHRLNGLPRAIELVGGAKVDQLTKINPLKLM
jgi:protein-tyrosine phosphatase